MSDMDVASSNHLNQSLSAEYLVAADLTRLGFPVSTAPGGLAYDLIVDIGSRLLRVQVKSCREERLPSGNNTSTRYVFTLQRAYKYSPSSFDIIAMVASDVGLIGYMAISEVYHKNRLYLAGPNSPSASKTLKIHELPFNAAVKTYHATTSFSLDEELSKAFGSTHK